MTNTAYNVDNFETLGDDLAVYLEARIHSGHGAFVQTGSREQHFGLFAGGLRGGGYDVARRALARYYRRHFGFWAKAVRRIKRTLRGDFGA